MRPPARRPATTATWWPLVVLTLVLLWSPAALGAEPAVLSVVVNTEQRGDLLVRLTNDGDVLVPAEDFSQLGFREVPGVVEVDGRPHVSLRSLAPALRFAVDLEASTLSITADPSLFRGTVTDLAARGPSNVVSLRDDTAVLNYGVVLSLGDGLEFTSLRVPWEVALSTGGFLGLSDFAYTRTGSDDRFVRLLSRVTREDPVRGYRIVLGDLGASSGFPGSAAILGGVGLSTDSSLTPYVSPVPALDVSSLAQAPADVSLFVNDALVRTARVGPGEVSFLNVPAPAGASEASLVIRDALGVERRIVVPFYRSTLLLRPGLHQYSYAVGFEREALGRRNAEYGRPAVLALHRYGLSHALTIGGRGEADRDTINLGPTANFLIGRRGEADARVAVSHEAGRIGYGGSAGAQLSARSLKARLAGSVFSRDYATLAVPAGQVEPRTETLAGLTYEHRTLGSLSAVLSRADRYVGSDLRRLSLAYTRGFPRGVSVHAAAGLTRAEQTSRHLFVGISTVLGSNQFGTLAYQTSDRAASQTVALQQSPPLGPGFGYRAALERREGSRDDTDVGGSAAVQYQGPYGLYALDYRRSGGHDSVDVAVSGAVAAVGRSVYLARPITDGFAVVKVSGLNGVPVYYSNVPVGVTGGDGELVVPNLLSHYGNSLSINDQDLPLNYRVSESRKYVSTAGRGGGRVQFDVAKIQAFGGRLILIEQGRRRAAEYAALEIQVGERTVEALVGKGGEFYMENVPPGRFPARLVAGDQRCRFELAIPERDEMMVDLGEVLCEVGN